MRNLIRRLAKFWSTDRSLTALFALLVLTLFVLPPTGLVTPFESPVFRIFYMLILVSGVLAATRNHRVTQFVTVLVVADILMGWAATFRPTTPVVVASLFLSLTALAMLVYVVLVQVFREGAITLHRVFGSVAAYLLLGLAWTVAYRVTDLLVPGCFNLQETGWGTRADAFVYYSFVTLSGVGYGDITPLHPVGRSLAIAEGLTGQLFPAILIARLVAMELYYRQARKEKRAHAAEKREG